MCEHNESVCFFKGDSAMAENDVTITPSASGMFIYADNCQQCYITQTSSSSSCQSVGLMI